MRAKFGAFSEAESAADYTDGTDSSTGRKQENDTEANSHAEAPSHVKVRIGEAALRADRFRSGPRQPIVRRSPGAGLLPASGQVSRTSRECVRRRIRGSGFVRWRRGRKKGGAGSKSDCGG